MTGTYTKPAVRHAWAENAGSTNITDPGDTYAATGWSLGVKPPRQYDNWAKYWVSAGIRYFCQVGIVDYDSAETYGIGAVVRGPDGLIYGSKVASNTGNTPSTSPTQWGGPNLFTPASGDNSHQAATTAFVVAGFIPKGSTFAALTGSIAPGQVPVGAITQWQGAIQLTFPQITGQIGAGQVPVGAVTQWQAALSIVPGQITGNINAATLSGLPLGPNAAFAGNQIPRYDSAGYLYAGYFNQASANNENPSISQVMVTNGTDNFLRKASLAALLAAFSPVQSKANPGYVTLPGGMILQWGVVSYSGAGGSSATFPKAFGTTCLACIVNASIGGYTPGITSFNATSVTFNTTNLGGTAQNFHWFAIGF